MQFTADQFRALQTAADFLQPGDATSKCRVMLLRGSAGTGKTTLLREILNRHGEDFDGVVLCAPTNKAARVLTERTGRSATTLHKLLYEPVETPEGVVVWVRRQPKSEKPVVFIADEASMIGDRAVGDEFFGGSRLLRDLLDFLHGGHAASRLILVGDPCQLPPVGYELREQAPALDPDYLLRTFNLRPPIADLCEVVRQAEGSYVLRCATSLRDFYTGAAADYRWESNELRGGASMALHGYMQRYDPAEDARVSILAWRNADVNCWNTSIRSRLGLGGALLMPGTKVLVDATWSDGKARLLNKGEVAFVKEIGGTETFADLRFQQVVLQSPDADGVVREVEGLAMLDHLTSYKGQLEAAQERYLRAEAMRLNEKYRKNRKPFNDRYVGALRLRWGYALTVHKAQGSEYEDVYLHPTQPPGDVRWLYTAVTRAKSELFTY